MSPTQRRLRIAFVYDAIVPYMAGGAERRVHELATRLAVHHEVHVVTWRYWGHEPTLARDGITYHGVGTPRPFYGADGKRTIREAAEFAVRAMPVVRRLGVDVVDVSATPYLPLCSTWLATRLDRTPLVATWHEFWGEHWAEYLPDRPVVARGARVLEAVARRMGDRRVAVSRLTARRMGGGTASGATTVVENGVDLDRIDAADPDELTSDVIHVGRLIDEKRVDVLLRAIAMLTPRHPSLRCVVVGQGPERPRLEGLTDDLGLRPNVTFLGHVPEARIPGLLKAARVLALPSLREGFGIAVVEAQAAGAVPVVARGPFTGAPDLVDDGRDGLVCDESVEGLAEAIGGMLDDDARRSRLAVAAREAARRQSWDDRAAEMEGVYFEASARRAPDRHVAMASVDPR